MGTKVYFKMWKIQKVTPAIIDEVIDDIPAETFFSSVICLNTFLNHGNLSLYVADNGNEKRIISYREHPGGFGRDARILFYKKKDDHDLIQAIKSFFNPELIVYNLVMDQVSDLFKQEIIIDVSKIALLVDKNIRKKYKYFEKKHPNIFVKRYDHDKDYKKTVSFLKNWKNIRSPNQNAIARIENDLYFLDNYGNNELVDGIIVHDVDKVIGISFFVKKHQVFVLA